MQALERCDCEKAAAYVLLRTGMVGGPAQDFTKHHEKDITHMRSHVYGEKSRLAKGARGYDANALYLYCSGDVMPCGRDNLVVNKKPFDQKQITKFSKDVYNEKFLGLRMLILKYPTRFMTNLARGRHCLLFKRFLIVMYLRK